MTFYQHARGAFIAADPLAQETLEETLPETRVKFKAFWTAVLWKEKKSDLKVDPKTAQGLQNLLKWSPNGS